MNTFRGKKDGTFWVTGSPKSDGGGTMQGTTGLNDQVSYSSPTQLPGTWTGDIASGRNYKLATKTDGTLWVWGENEKGGLGLNGPVNKNLSSPTQVGTDTTWAITIGSVACTQHTSLAIKANGTLWSWGQNEAGQMAFGNQPVNYRRSSPTQVGTDSTWNTVEADTWGGAMATKTDGTMWTWGTNSLGNLGLNNLSQRSSPAQVGTETTWGGGINLGNLAAMATKTDGTLWVWGYGQYNGQLGLGTNNNRSSPVQIPGTTWKTGMNDVASTTYARGAIKTDGTLWAWGQNEVGQLGLNDKTTRSDPSQVPGTGWIALGGMIQTKGFHALKK